MLCLRLPAYDPHGEGQVKWVEPSGNAENTHSNLDHSTQYSL